MASDQDMGADAQDQAELFDETNITRDGQDIAHPDMARDVLDVRSSIGASRKPSQPAIRSQSTPAPTDLHCVRPPLRLEPA